MWGPCRTDPTRWEQCPLWRFCLFACPTNGGAPPLCMSLFACEMDFPSPMNSWDLLAWTLVWRAWLIPVNLSPRAIRFSPTLLRAFSLPHPFLPWAVFVIPLCVYIYFFLAWIIFRICCPQHVLRNLHENLSAESVKSAFSRATSYPICPPAFPRELSFLCECVRMKQWQDTRKHLYCLLLSFLIMI